MPTALYRELWDLEVDSGGSGGAGSREFVEAMKKAKKTGRGYKLLLPEPALRYMASSSGALDNTIDILKDRVNSAYDLDEAQEARKLLALAKRQTPKVKKLLTANQSQTPKKANMSLRKTLIRLASTMAPSPERTQLIQVLATSKTPDGGDAKDEGGDDKGSEDPGEHPGVLTGRLRTVCSKGCTRMVLSRRRKSGVRPIGS